MESSPWCHVVCNHPVEVVDGDHILGDLLIIGHTGVLKTVTPQDLVGQVGSPHLAKVFFTFQFDSSFEGF